MSSPVIDVQNIHTRYGTEWVHQGLDLTINAGEIVALIGESGCGKTTLLRTMLLLLPPSQGELFVFGKNIRRLSLVDEKALKCRWGVMYQHSALFGSLSIVENVMFPLREFTQLPLRTIYELARLKLSLVGLASNVADKYPSELSGGMKKRAAMARAIALDPDILFLDEPTAGLDPHSAGALDELILTLRAALGLTIVLVTHDLDSLWQVPDQIAFIAEKKIVAKLPISALVQYAHPAVTAYFAGERAQARMKAFGG